MSSLEDKNRLYYSNIMATQTIDITQIIENINRQMVNKKRKKETNVIDKYKHELIIDFNSKELTLLVQ